MSKQRTYSRYCVKAVALLAQQIKLARKQRKMTEKELADRAGIARATLQKIEKGDTSVAIGFYFETAALVGINLFNSDKVDLSLQLDRLSDKIALLPKSVHKTTKDIDDDF